MPNIRNVLIDLNGCLIGPPSREFYEGLWESAQIAELTKQEQARFIMGACTGREMQYVRGALHLIGSPRGWSVCESGLGIFDVENEIWIPQPRTDELRPLFENEISRAVVSLMSQHPKDLRLYRGNMLHIAIELTGQAKITVETLFIEAKQALRRYEEEGLIKIRHSSDTVDITAFDKGDGLALVEKKTGISRQETLAIGDSENDIPILELAGFVGCPENASLVCKNYVQRRQAEGTGWVSKEKHSGGVANIIRHYTGG